MSTSLSQTLREVSFGGHEEPEEKLPEPNYHTAYLRGGLNVAGVAAQFAQHFLMYEALENATQAYADKKGEFFAFWLPELHRLPALRDDLQFWLGDNWEAEVRSNYADPGITNYVNRINAVAPTSFPHYVAHHYTRYLADLSGGFMIAKMFRKHYGDEGTSFYSFPEIPDPKQYKNDYRALLDSLEFTDDEIQTIAGEVKLAYQLNNTAGADLQARFATEFQA
ncbi:MAG: heme oxygenase (biliverdin-producing) [Canibacter sp.]